MHSLTGFQRDLLSVITCLSEPNGQEVKAELQESQDRSVGNARLYANLDTLVDERYVDKRMRDGRTNSYTLTEKGRREVQKRFAWEERRLSAKREAT